MKRLTLILAVLFSAGFLLTISAAPKKGKNKAAYAGREYALPEGAVIMEVMR